MAYWFSGWESGDSSEWQNSGGTFSVQTTTVNPGGGNYALQAGLLSGTLGNNYNQTASTFTSGTTLFAGGYFRLHSLSASIAVRQYVILGLQTGAGAETLEVCVTTDAGSNPSLQLYNQVAGAAVGSAFAVSLDTWFLLEVKLIASASVGVMEMRVNGIVQATGSSLNTGTATSYAPYVGALNIVGTGTPNGQTFVDDVYLNTTGYIGPGVVLARQFTSTTPNYDTFTKSNASTINTVWDDTPFATATNATDAVSTGKQTGVVDFSTTGGGASSGSQHSGPAVISRNDTINAVKIGGVAKTGTASDAADSIIFRTPAGGSGVDTITAFAVGWATVNAGWLTTDHWNDVVLSSTPTANQVLNCEAGVQHNATTNTHTYEDWWMMVHVTPGTMEVIARPAQFPNLPAQPQWAPVWALHPTIAPFRAANLPDPYRQSMPPVPAWQAGMQPWQAPIIQARQWNVVFRAANLPDPYTWARAPIPAWQAGMQQWWAPVFALHPTITELNIPPPLDVQVSGFPFQALGQAWWAPVPALHPTITEFHGATDRDWHPVGFPFQAIGQSWWAPVWALHPTITEFHGATELDFHPTKFPYPAIQQGWQLQYVRIPPYGRNDIGIVAIPISTPTGFPFAAIQQGMPMAPVTGISGHTSSVGPVVGADPIVVWRHRAGMQ